MSRDTRVPTLALGRMTLPQPSAELSMWRRDDVLVNVRPHVVVENGVVVVSGSISVGCSGWHFSASAARQRRRLTVTVYARQETEDFEFTVEDFVYRIALTRLAAGPYRLCVLHLLAPAGTMGQPLSLQVLETRIVVP